jgi:subtilase family serine protease
MHVLRMLAVALVAALPLALAPAASSVNSHASYRAVCPEAGLAAAHCHAAVITDNNGNPNATAAPTGYGPPQFQTAYSLPSATAGSGQTVAIVDAYDDPNAESDLAVYSSQYGLPACTTANGCFKKVNQTGGSNPPRPDHGWALEISLDVQIAHAICPNCKILLVEASTNYLSDLSVAEGYAAGHANVVSNSYGAKEFSGETSYDGAYNHPGVPITVSSGDSGYGVEWPAASPYVTAVGGTTLNLNANNTRASETAWNGSGSGCSSVEPQPSWQNFLQPGCTHRSVADVSADADPNTGAAVYDSYGYYGQKGWFQVGGTSLSAPLIASVYALAGNGAATVYGSYPYTHTSSLYDVTQGSNGRRCSPSYLCTAGPGYDGPTGLGTPIGVGAF